MTEITLRTADEADLAAINRVIEDAVMGWDLPERVKRLALPSYWYDEQDLSHLTLIVAEHGERIVGIAALDSAKADELPTNQTGLLLHGLYVDPAQQHRGIGTRLLQRAEQHAQQRGLDGLLVRAQSGAGAFFARYGMQALAAEDNAEYQYRYWRPIRNDTRSE